MRLFLSIGLFSRRKFTVMMPDRLYPFPCLFIPPSAGNERCFYQPLLLKKQKEIALINMICLALAWFTGFMINKTVGPLPAVSISLNILLFGGIIGSELVWQKHKRKLAHQPLVDPQTTPNPPVVEIE
jgi:hypothetical protein